MPNRLIEQSSLYLQQHALNPVDWYPYGGEAFEEAARLNKPILVSIGYASCHWCHVMERESFEDAAIAELMNRCFVCVKVDREERPDVDHLYMDAVQKISGHGGWPLNCFALPDGRPFWGGSYFRREQWQNILEEIARLYNEQRYLLEEQAENLVSELRNSWHPATGTDSFQFNNTAAIEHLINLFDFESGGIGMAPKFPMPAVWDWVLFLKASGNRESFEEIFNTTLLAMARGGIFDQAGGGFARYSTDRSWKVPHFEKMLYDNAQLLGLYSDAFREDHHPEYERILEETAQFMLRDLQTAEGAFCASIDADSENEEGKYYTWTAEKFREALGHYSALAGEYFGLGNEGLLEHDRSILLRPHEDALFAQRHFLSETELRGLLSHVRGLLLNARQKRVPPATDLKIITSWNALAISGFVKASLASGSKAYLEVALRTAGFILQNMTGPGEILFRIHDQNGARIPAFLDDYAFLADAFTGLYLATLEEKWLNAALLLTETAIRDFYDETSGFFFYSNKQGNTLVNKCEIHDHVMPSSNAVMAGVLFSLGTFLERSEWVNISESMVKEISRDAERYPATYAAWLKLMAEMKDFRVVAIVGKEACAFSENLMRHYIPSAFIAGSPAASDLPYFRGRFHPGKTTIHICTGDRCMAPVESVDEALRILQQHSW